MVIKEVREQRNMAKSQAPCDGPGCAGLMAISLIGSELKLSVLHSLMGGPRRFNELRTSSGICQSSLAKTLKELEEAGIMERRVILERPVAVEYHLTAMGQDLSDALRGLERWANRWVTADHSRKVIA